MTTFLFLVILSEVLLPNLSYTSRVRRQDTRVRISSTGDTIMLKFLQSDHDTKLAGYIVGYGRTMFSKQFIQLPENGEPYETVIDAEPKYLIAVQPINEDVVKKECSGKDILDKPLHLVIGSVTPNSVLLSWGTIVRTSSDTEANQVDCVEDSQYTVRYRQKESSKNWSYQTCPTTDTVIDKLSPSTTYEFGVRAETDTVNGRWSPPVTHNTADITAPVSPGNLISSLATTSGIPIPTEVTFHKSYFVPIKNVTSSRMTSTFRHTTSIPLQNTTLVEASGLEDKDAFFIFITVIGTESDGIASSPSSEDSLFLKHTYAYSRMSTPPSRSAHHFQPKSVTATQQQLTSKKTPLSTSQISKSKILPSTDNAMHSHRTIDILSTAHHQPETSTSQVQFTMIKYIPKATPKNPLTPQHLSITLQPITIQSQTYSTKSQPSATQSLTDTTHSHPHTSQSPPILTKSSTTKSGSSTSKTHPKITKPAPRKPQEPSMTQSKRIVQKSSTSQPQNTDKIYQPVPSLPTNSILDNSVTNKLLTYSSTKSDRKQNYESPHKNPQHTQYLLSTEADTSSPTTSQYLSFTAEYTPSPTETKDLYSTSSIETKSYPSNLPPVVTKSTNSHFITSLYYKSVQTQIPIESKPKTTNEPYNTTIHVLHVPNKPYKKWEPPSKSNYSQNSSQTEKTMVSKKPPGHKQGRFSTTHSVVHQSAPTVTQSPKQMQDTQPPTSPVSLKSDRNQDQINSSTAVHPLVHPVTNAPSQRQDGQLLPKPYRVKTNRSQDQEKSLSSIVSPSASGKRQANTSSLPLVQPLAEAEIQPHDEKHKGIAQAKPVNEPQTNQELQGNPRVPFKTKPNQVEKEKEVKIADVPDLKQLDKLPLLKPQGTPFAEKSVYPTTVPTPTLFTPNGSRFDMGDNSSGFSAVPGSDVDAMGKKRFVAPHVIYKTDKPPDEPCSVTQSLSYFPEEDGVSVNITGPPRTPPTNLTVVTVEGCPSFIILDWEKTDNETTEYDVTSAIKSPNGDEVSVVTTNQTHTAVENLKPESSYEFTVIPKNELGSGPPSEPVSFNTESADPRVSEIPTGKNAIWSSFPFKADSYSECTGTMYVKRTWYRKFVGIQLCNSLRYKIYLSDSLKGKFYNIGDVSGNGEDHCQFVDSYLDGRTGGTMSTNRLPPRKGFFRSMRQEPVRFGKIGGNSHINYVAWYECGVPIPGSW